MNDGERLGALSERTGSDGGPPAGADGDLAARLVDVVKEYTLRRGAVLGRKPRLEAVAGVSLSIARGETLGLVGESGSGKSTVARLLMRLLEPTAGRVEVGGEDVTHARGTALLAMRRRAQMVFQDPYSSFDPLSVIGDSVGEPLHTHFGLTKRQRDARVGELLTSTNLRPEHAQRYPSELSGGQLQRAAVARALASNPQLLVLDEPVSALDVSTQAQVINLFQDLQQELAVAYLFIAHDLSVVRHISHRIAVMYLGRIVESGPADAVYTSPAHPYAAALLEAVPVPDPACRRRRVTLRGDIPSPANPPSGCRFRTRCPVAMEICAREDPPPFTTAAGVTVYCHLHRHGPQLDGESVTAFVRSRQSE